VAHVWDLFDLRLFTNVGVFVMDDRVYLMMPVRNDVHPEVVLSLLEALQEQMLDHGGDIKTADWSTDGFREDGRMVSVAFKLTDEEQWS
jgi:hypothetical protein